MLHTIGCPVVRPHLPPPTGDCLVFFPAVQVDSIHPAPESHQSRSCEAATLASWESASGCGDGGSSTWSVAAAVDRSGPGWLGWEIEGSEAKRKGWVGCQPERRHEASAVGGSCVRGR